MGPRQKSQNLEAIAKFLGHFGPKSQNLPLNSQKSRHFSQDSEKNSQIQPQNLEKSPKFRPNSAENPDFEKYFESMAVMQPTSGLVTSQHTHHA